MAVKMSFHSKYLIKCLKENKRSIGKYKINWDIQIISVKVNALE